MSGFDDSDPATVIASADIFMSLELARRTVSAAMPLVGERGIKEMAKMLQTCCVRCDIRDTCDVAFEFYNVDREPKIDCLATK